MSKDYAEIRASILKDLDGLQYEVDAGRKLGGCGSIGRRSTWSRIAVAARSPPSWRRSARIPTSASWSSGQDRIYTSGGDVKAFRRSSGMACRTLPGTSLRRSAVPNR